MKGAKETLSKKLFDQYEIRFLRLEQLKKKIDYLLRTFVLNCPAASWKNMKQLKHHHSSLS